MNSNAEHNPSTLANDSDLMRKADEAVEFFRSCYAKNAGMFIIFAGGFDSSHVENTATASFVDTGTARFVVTCRHVYERFEELGRQDRRPRLGIAGHKKMPLDITSSTEISRGGDGVDLITLRLPEPGALESVGKAYYSATSWPPDRVRIDKTVDRHDAFLTIGYPRELATIEGRILQAKSLTISAAISSLSERNFVMADDRELDPRTWVKMSHSSPSLRSVGGMSGAPVWRLDETGRIDCISLAGFLYNADFPDSALKATLIAHHADYIDASGGIREALR